jgi:hypothetical protein
MGDRRGCLRFRDNELILCKDSILIFSIKAEEVASMKRGLVVALALLFTVASVGSAVAQGVFEELKIEFGKKLALAKSQKFSGQVVSHDVLCHCLVVKMKSGKTLVLNDDYAEFMQGYNQAKGLKIGSQVVGEYKTVDSIDYATTLAYADDAATTKAPAKKAAPPRTAPPAVTTPGK